MTAFLSSLLNFETNKFRAFEINMLELSKYLAVSLIILSGWEYALAKML